MSSTTSTYARQALDSLDLNACADPELAQRIDDASAAVWYMSDRLLRHHNNTPQARFAILDLCDAQRKLALAALHLVDANKTGATPHESAVDIITAEHSMRDARTAIESSLSR